MDEFLKTWYGVLVFVAFDLVALTLVVCITYRWFFKRVLDFLTAGLCILFVSPLLLLVGLRGKSAKARGEIDKIVRATPFVGKKEKIVKLHAFETQNEKGETGGYGAWLTRTGFYALPKLFDVFAGRLSFIGCKPFSEGDCVFLTDEEEDRHIAKGGLINPLVKTGDGQTDYEDMLLSDRSYAWRVSFFGDVGIFFTWLLKKIRGEGKAYLGQTRQKSYAKYLLDEERITQADYDEATAG